VKTQERLSRETVADAALALADAEGLDALTIRRLAQELGVTPMALYWHFKNKDELLAGVADRIWALIDRERDPGIPPMAQFRALLSSLIGVLRVHRAATPLLMMPRENVSEHFLETTETALQIVTELGFDTATAAAICQLALRTVTSLVAGEPGVVTPPQTAEQAQEVIRRKRLAFESLSPAKYPHVIAAATPLTSCDDPDRHYALGLDFFMAGLRGLAGGELFAH
jgi:AcrR family transcriptional regulator